MRNRMVDKIIEELLKKAEEDIGYYYIIPKKNETICLKNIVLMGATVEKFHENAYLVYCIGRPFGFPEECSNIKIGGGVILIKE
jgi:hypothetical protein